MFTYIWLKCMFYVGKYSINRAFGIYYHPTVHFWDSWEISLNNLKRFDFPRYSCVLLPDKLFIVDNTEKYFIISEMTIHPCPRHPVRHRDLRFGITGGPPKTHAIKHMTSSRCDIAWDVYVGLVRWKFHPSTREGGNSNIPIGTWSNLTVGRMFLNGLVNNHQSATVNGLNTLIYTNK